MWQRFTEHARQAILLGQQAAAESGGSFVGSSHLLLGFVGCPESGASLVLVRAGLSLDAVAMKTQELLPSSAPPAKGEPKLTPRCKRVLELAADEARRMGHHGIGTEHLLLGILRMRNYVARKPTFPWSRQVIEPIYDRAPEVLESLGIELAAIRTLVRGMGQAAAYPSSISIPPIPSPTSPSYSNVPARHSASEPNSRRRQTPFFQFGVFDPARFVLLVAFVVLVVVALVAPFILTTPFILSH